MSKESAVREGGVGVLGLLGVTFVALKLLKLIDWSWWWVTAPFWGGLALVLLVLVLFLIFIFFESMIHPYLKRRQPRKTDRGKYEWK